VRGYTRYSSVHSSAPHICGTRPAPSTARALITSVKRAAGGAPGLGADRAVLSASDMKFTDSGEVSFRARPSIRWKNQAES
jgi:hypothetical protein